MAVWIPSPWNTRVHILWNTFWRRTWDTNNQTFQSTLFAIYQVISKTELESFSTEVMLTKAEPDGIWKVKWCCWYWFCCCWRTISPHENGKPDSTECIGMAQGCSMICLHLFTLYKSLSFEKLIVGCVKADSCNWIPISLDMLNMTIEYPFRWILHTSALRYLR